MDYSFRRDETSAEAARRIAREQLERALVELQAETDLDQHVHSVRKRLKKLRGLVRLLQPALGPQVFSRENACYRDAGRALAGPRRAAAVVDAFDALVAQRPGWLSEEETLALRGSLVAERERLVAVMHRESHTRAVAELLQGSLARLSDWPLDSGGWELLKGGFRRSYRRGRRGQGLARREPTTEHLHEWRKAAKHYWYHVRLLERIWPEAMKALKHSLEELTEELGAEHDLDDLRLALIERTPSPELAPATARVLAAIEQRRGELRARAFARGQHLYAERSRAATRRMGEYFAAWLSEPDRPAGDAGADD